MVELVLVIVLLAILSSVAAPRFFDNDAFDERAYYDELVSALRYAQKVAVASGCPVRIDIAVSAYSLAQQSASAGHCDPSDTTFSLPVTLPTGESMAGTAPPGIFTAPVLTFDFDALGRTSLGADLVLTVGARSMTIQAGSGLVVTP